MIQSNPHSVWTRRQRATGWTSAIVHSYSQTDEAKAIENNIESKTMPSPDPVLAICINWNGERVLHKTVDSLLHCDYAALKVLVVDNASDDKSACSLPSTVEVMKLEANLGYGGAINAALRSHLDADSAPYFLLLNNDVLLAKDTLSRLIGFASDKGPGIFGPRIVQFEDSSRLEAAWGKVTWSHVLASYYGKNRRKIGARWNRMRQVELLLGSTLLVHRRIFEKVGLFDEAYFMYHEEVDFLFRARRSGFPIYYCPFTEVIHYGGHSTRRQPLKKTYWIRRNAVYFLRKHRASRLQ